MINVSKSVVFIDLKKPGLMSGLSQNRVLWLFEFIPGVEGFLDAVAGGHGDQQDDSAADGGGSAADGRPAYRVTSRV